MLDRSAFNTHCASLPATFMVEQWGEAHVWKVGSAQKSKVFALSSFWVGKDGDETGAERVPHGIVFKVSPMSFELLTQETGIAQAPYFAKGQWVRAVEDNPLTEDELRRYISEAHRIMAAGLTKKLQAELGLLDLAKGQGSP